MAQKRTKSAEPLKQRGSAMTQEAREAQIAALGLERLAQRLADGTASGQEVITAVRLGSIKTQYEIEKIKYETEKIKAQKEVLDSSKRSEEMYTKAISVMRTYMGLTEEVDGEPYILGID